MSLTSFGFTAPIGRRSMPSVADVADGVLPDDVVAVVEGHHRHAGLAGVRITLRSTLVARGRPAEQTPYEADGAVVAVRRDAHVVVA